MKKFSVLINGRNFIMDLGDGSQKRGFYAKRFIEAKDAEDAELLAVETIRNDDKLKTNTLNNTNDPPMLFAEEILELESFDGIDLPGVGYSFYPDDEKQTLQITMKKWKYKLLVAVGLIYPIFSLPFLTGLLTPSMHEGNLYSTLFVLIHSPVIILLGDFVDVITERLFSDVTLYKSNMIFLTVSYVFWLILGLLIGTVMDKASGKKESQLET